jgi:thiol:disulfide interchange protein
MFTAIRASTWLRGLMFAVLLGVMGAIFLPSMLYTFFPTRAPSELVTWRTSFPAAEAEAQRTGKPMLIYFTASWCPVCQGLKTTLWADPRVAQALNKYVPVKLDVDLPENQPLAAAAAGPGAQSLDLPAFVAADGHGQARMTVGGMDSAQFLSWLDASGANLKKL